MDKEIGGLKIENVKYYWIPLVIGALITVLYSVNHEKYLDSFIISIGLFIIVCIVIISKINSNLIEPLTLFSLLYSTSFMATWYLCITDFKTNNFTFGTSYNNDFSSLWFKTNVYFLLGYICLLIGYKLVNINNTSVNLLFEGSNKISDRVLNFCIKFFFIIGVMNFMLNVYKITHGNIIHYFGMLGTVSDKISMMGGTTFGYNFIEWSAYLIIFKSIRNNINLNIKDWCVIFIAIMIVASKGRVFSTMTMMLVIVGLYYYGELNRGKLINKKFISMVAVILFIGIFLYMMRRSSFVNNGNWIESIKNGYNDILYYAFDRGNTVNMAIMPKIFDSWNEDIGFLYGKSFLLSLMQYPLSVLGIGVENYYWTIKYTWFYEVTGGGLPPTIIGEMYMNFGFIGVILGMMCFGILMKCVYKWFLNKQNYLRTIIYLQIALGFFLLVPKTASGNFPFFNIAFSIIIYYMMIIFTKIENLIMEEKSVKI